MNDEIMKVNMNMNEWWNHESKYEYMNEWWNHESKYEYEWMMKSWK